MLDQGLSHGHPLSSGSRRRRMLVLRSTTAQEPTDNVALDDVAPAGVRSPQFKSTGLDSDEFEPCPATAGPLDQIGEMIDDAVPRTWLFTGDNLGFDARKSKRGCIEFFSDVMKGSLRRKLDVILDTTIADSKVATLRQHADWRIMRFEPDVVFVTPGSRDVALGEHGCERFETTLKDLTLTLQQEGAIAALCTPPPLGEQAADIATMYADAVRRTAIECDAILVDHWKHWTRCSYVDQLVDSSGLRPTLAGHQKLARNLLRSIGVRDF